MSLHIRPTSVLVSSCYALALQHYLNNMVNRRRLAVALPDRVAVYELPAGVGDSDMGYRLVATVPRHTECSCVALLPDSLVICQVRCQAF